MSSGCRAKVSRCRLSGFAFTDLSLGLIVGQRLKGVRPKVMCRSFKSTALP